MEFIFRKYIILPFLFLCFIAGAQENSVKTNPKKPFFTEKGIFVGYGAGLDSTNLPEGQYCPIFLIVRLGMTPFKSKLKKVIPGTFTLFFEPQFNPVVIRKPEGNEWNYEFGANVGIQYSYPITKAISVYTLMSVGPHYMSAYTSVQSQGFLFSDNLGIGTILYPTETWAINFGFKIRHISNAETHWPNHGINTFNYLIGISKIIR